MSKKKNNNINNENYNYEHTFSQVENEYYADDYGVFDSGDSDFVSEMLDKKAEKYTEVIAPVIAKINEYSVVVEYNGYGFVVNVDNSDIPNVTLKVSGVIGEPNFTFEVV